MFGTYIDKNNTQRNFKQSLSNYRKSDNTVLYFHVIHIIVEPSWYKELTNLKFTILCAALWQPKAQVLLKKAPRKS